MNIYHPPQSPNNQIRKSQTTSEFRSETNTPSTTTTDFK